VQVQAEKRGEGDRTHVRVQRQCAADGVDGGVEPGAQPVIAAAAHRPLDLHRRAALRVRAWLLAATDRSVSQLDREQAEKQVFLNNKEKPFGSRASVSA